MLNFSLVKKFSLLLLIALLLFGFSLEKVISSVIRQNTITRSNEITANFLQYEINNHLQLKQLVNPESVTGYQEVSRRLADLNLGPDEKIIHINIWNDKRAIVWSSGRDKVVTRNFVHHDLNAVFNGKIVSTILTGRHVKEKFGRDSKTKEMMELFIPVRFEPHGDVKLVFEVYSRVDNLMGDIAHHNKIVWLSILFGSVILYLLLFGLFWGASRQIDQQNKKIRLSEERYRNLIHSAQDGIVSAGRSGKIFLMNEAAELIFDYTIDAAQTISFADLFVPEQCEEFHDQLRRFFEAGDCSFIGKSFEAEGVRKSGETFPLEVSLSVSGEKDNCMLTGLIRDITQRNQLFEQIAAAKNEWEESFDTINDAITIHDNNFNIIRANRAAEDMLGLSLGTILKRKCFRSYHGKEGPPSDCSSCQTLKTGLETTTEVYEAHLNKHLEIKALPRFDDKHRMIGVVHVVRDITARKKAEEQQVRLQDQLNHAQKMESVGRLAGGVAHDFNNILSAIIGFSELAQKELPPESEPFQHVTSIKEAGEKAAVLAGQLLAFSRNQVLNMKPVDLNKIAEDLAKILARVIGEDIVLDLRLAPDIGTVVADLSQIEQVFLNLAVNARDAMPGGGHFIIETSMVELDKNYVDQHAEVRLGPHVLLTATDTGTGIEKRVKAHIFDPFFTTKEVGKGTGLGLATVYGIIKQHGGQIDVYSEMGKGTTFKIYLPVTIREAIEPAKQPLESIPAGDETILLAEDDDTIRMMLEASLRAEGYTLLLAADGREAIGVSNFHDGDIHLLLTDVVMPDINGRELADTLKKTRPDMQVIFMSGYTNDFIVHHGILDSGVNFIQKPLTLNGLAIKLREVLGKL